MDKFTLLLPVKYLPIIWLTTRSLAILLFVGWILVLIRDYLVYEKAILPFGLFGVLAMGVLGGLFHYS